MTAKFLDQRDQSNPDHGTVLMDGASTKRVLTRNSKGEPFFAELVSDARTKLLIGLGPRICCAQFTNVDDEPPYLLARITSENSRSGFAKFVIGNEPTEVPRRLCIPLSLLLDVAAYFVETGQPSPNVAWEEL